MAFDQDLPHVHAGDGALTPVFRPCRPGDISPNDALDIDSLCLLYDHSLPGYLIRHGGFDTAARQILGGLRRIGQADEVVGNDVFGEIKPKGGDSVQYQALSVMPVGNTTSKAEIRSVATINRCPPPRS